MSVPIYGQLGGVLYFGLGFVPVLLFCLNSSSYSVFIHLIYIYTVHAISPLVLLEQTSLAFSFPLNISLFTP